MGWKTYCVGWDLEQESTDFDGEEESMAWDGEQECIEWDEEKGCTDWKGRSEIEASSGISKVSNGLEDV
ncbi:MAG: hypothetical protein AAF587_44520 [Bacteroidota bacterium]